jgi:hypothetical protein
MKSTNFWDITPCSPLSVNRRFGGIYRSHLQGRRNVYKKPARKQVASRAVESTDVSEEYIASIFRVENISRATNQRESRWHAEPLRVNRLFGGTYRLHLHLQVASLLSGWFLAQLIFSILKMEAIWSSETSVDTQRTTWRYIPENGTHQV